MNGKISRLVPVIVAIGLLVAPSARAQLGLSDRMNSLVSLARYEAVQKDLGVSSEVAGKLGEVYDAYRNASDREFKALGFDNDSLRDLPALEQAAEMRKADQKSLEINRDLAARFSPKLEELLTREQIERLKQIQLQANAVEIWLDPLFVKQLDLSDAQVSQLAELQKEYRQRQQQVDGDFRRLFTRIRELSIERDAKGIKILNDMQRAKLTELQGTPFDPSQLVIRRR